MLKSVDQPSSELSSQVEYDLPSERRAAHPVKLAAKAGLQAILAAAVLFGAVMAMNYLVATKPEVPKRQFSEKSYSVETVLASKANHTPDILVYGEATAGRTVDMRSLVAGEVVAVHPNLKAGGQVKKGETLVSIDRFDYEGAVTEARANLAEAQATLVERRGRVELEKANVVRAREQLEFAQKDLERAEDLLKRGSVTERTVDERKFLVSQRQQNLEQRQNTLSLESAKVTQQEAAIDRFKWRLENAERQLEDTVLKAPFDGIIRSEAAQVGRLVNVNDVIASLFASDELEVRFTLSDEQYGRLVAESGTVVGRSVQVEWSLGAKTAVYEAEIDRIGADVASSRGGVDVYAKVALNPDQTPLRPGAFVEVLVPDQTYAGTFKIPETSFYGQGTVYVIEQNRLSPRTVKAVAVDDGYIIVEGGLADGDAVLSTRIPEAGEGLLVRPMGAEGRAPNEPEPAQTAARMPTE
ncbi:HlyD family secretion protein [Roseibium sp. TrichSKD4]|uniref:efflux RND transporter periplasmic adaptor subunit n=1 Tax=Roseibium sp. TrichSKD4 TaxID=744980 RepID=UPI0001E56711|nr:efflux RND transporter periplasmic adaptor subunit [Roseibium sp. TrichSKD4]EFO34322.1 HlyD family secretion protein [Roseibium sp. TrichSKD4]